MSIPDAAQSDMLAKARDAAEVAFMSKFADAFPLRASQQNVLQGSIRHAVDEVTPIIIEYATRKTIHDASHEIAEAWLSRTLGVSVK